MGRATSIISAAFALALLSPTVSAVAQESQESYENNSGVVLIYHRFGEDDIPSTNIRLDQFDAQLRELTTGGYNFPAVDAFIDGLTGRAELPDRSVLITIDDGYSSAAQEAWPRLRAAGIPLLFFIATDPVDQQLPGYISWDEIRRLQEEGVTIGHHGAGHIYMSQVDIEAAAADLDRADARFAEELGFVPDIFAYPFGEFDTQIRNLVESREFRAAFGQYSGVAPRGTDPFALPRFPVNERFGEMDRFRLIVNTRAFPATDILPKSARLEPADNPPAYGFSLTQTIPGLSGLACYPSHMSVPADISVIRNRRVEVRFDEPFPPGRNRINCTMPGAGGRWYWLGRYFYVPE